MVLYALRLPQGVSDDRDQPAEKAVVRRDPGPSDCRYGSGDDDPDSLDRHGRLQNHVDVYQLKVFFTPTLENFRTVFQSPYSLHDKLFNSTVVALATVLVAIPVATMAAYSFSRFRLVGERIMFVMILATQFVPAVVIVLPFFVMFRDIGLLDTRVGLIIVNLSIVMPFAVWMIKGFIDGIPIDTEEVGAGRRLDARAGHPQYRASDGGARNRHCRIFCFIVSWNDFLFALILTTNEAVTLPVGLALFKAEEGDLWNLLAAAGIIIMVPMFILALIIQKHFVQGMTMGAVR